MSTEPLRRSHTQLLRYAVMCVVIAATACLFNGAGAGDSTWMSVQPLPSALGHTPAVVYNNRIYVAGGEGPSGNIRTDVNFATIQPDGTLGDWLATTPLPSPRHYHALVEANGYLYVIGGATTTWTPMGTVYFARINDDGTVGAWSTSYMPAVRAGLSAVSRAGVIYIIGGSDATELKNTVYVARSRTSDGNLVWSSPSTTTALPLALGWAGAAATDGHLYVVGGHDGSQKRNSAYRAAFNADGTLGGWIEEPSLIAARANTALVASGGYLYAIAGLGSDGTSLSTVEASRIRADGSLDGWSSATSLPNGLHDHGAAAANWRLYAVGGYNTSAAEYQSAAYKIAPYNVYLKEPICGQYIRGASIDHFPYFLPDGSAEPWLIDPYIYDIFQENGYARISGAMLLSHVGAGDGYANRHWLMGYDAVETVAGCGTVDAAELESQSEYLTVTPGASAQIWINVRNSGTTIWRAEDGYTWRGTGQREGESGAIWQEVAPGGTLNYAQTISAPVAPGIYTYGFILQHNGQDFGLHFFIQVTVSATAPSAEFDAWPQTGDAPLTVSMHIVSTDNITNCEWDYGDGQMGSSCAAYHDHTYAAPDVYTVRLTVSGPGGTDSMTREHYITVNPPAGSKKWTVMLFQAWDGQPLDLGAEWDASAHVSALKQDMRSNDALNLVMFWDGNLVWDRPSYTYFSPNGPIEQSLPGEVNTGDPATLQDFINWTRTNYPAEHYALIISSHGHGLTGVAPDHNTGSSLSVDTLTGDTLTGDTLTGDTSTGDPLTGKELSGALANTMNLDILYLDNCLMGNIETLWELVSKNGDTYTERAEYVVASEATSTAVSYLPFLQQISMSTQPSDLAAWMAQTYHNEIARIGAEGTMSVIYMPELFGIVMNLASLADGIRNLPAAQRVALLDATNENLQRFWDGEDDLLVDLWRFSELVDLFSTTLEIKRPAQIIRAIWPDVVLENYSIGYSDAHGISIMLPLPDKKRCYYSADSFTFATDANWGCSFTAAATAVSPVAVQLEADVGWGSLLVDYVQLVTPNAPEVGEPPSPVAPLSQALLYLPIVTRTQ